MAYNKRFQNWSNSRSEFNTGYAEIERLSALLNAVVLSRQQMEFEFEGSAPVFLENLYEVFECVAPVIGKSPFRDEVRGRFGVMRDRVRRVIYARQKAAELGVNCPIPSVLLKDLDDLRQTVNDLRQRSGLGMPASRQERIVTRLGKRMGVIKEAPQGPAGED